MDFKNEGFQLNLTFAFHIEVNEVNKGVTRLSMKPNFLSHYRPTWYGGMAWMLDIACHKSN